MKNYQKIDKSNCISLSKGQVTIVSEDDYKYLSQYSWYFKPKKGNVGGYAKCDCFNEKRVYMHRVINKTPDGLFTDHINGNGLDNRRCNLRSCTNRQNLWGTGKSADNTSGYKGVTWDKEKRKWLAQIRTNYKYKFLGYFDDKKDAAKAYDLAAKEQRGEYAYQNFK